MSEPPDLVVLADAFAHLDPNRLPGTGDRHGLVIELDSIDPLIEVGGVAYELHEVPDPKLLLVDLHDGGVHVPEVVSHRPVYNNAVSQVLDRIVREWRQ